MCLRFFLDYKDKISENVVRTQPEISIHYLKNGFFFDFITTLPILKIIGKDHLGGHDDHIKLLYLVKILRISKGYHLLDTYEFKQKIHKIYELKRKKIAEHLQKTKADVEEETCIDHTEITTEIAINYVFMVLKLVLTTFNAAYFIGIFWYILCNLYHDWIATHWNDPTHNKDSFIEAYDIYKKYNSWEQTVATTYFAFTSLSTVGFGDYHPMNSFERIICVLIFIFGNGIFGFIIGEIMAMIEKLQMYNQSND